MNGSPPPKKPTAATATTASNTPVDKPAPQEMHALVVDDEFANRDFMVRLLQQTRLEVHGAGTAKKALEVVDELGTKIVLVMLDHRLPDTPGIELLKEMRTRLPEAAILMATMHDERAMMRDAFEAGCTGFMVKPHGFMELYKRIKDVTEQRDVLDELDKLIFDQHGTRNWRG